jgi:hypothetical protein
MGEPAILALSRPLPFKSPPPSRVGGRGRGLVPQEPTSLGSLSHQRSFDRLHSARQTVHDLLIGKADHTKSLIFQPARPSAIRIDSQVVRRAVDLDHQPCRETDEVDDVVADPILAPEPDTTDALVAQLVPQQTLCLGLVLPQVQDALVGRGLAASKTPSPYPPPARGGGTLFEHALQSLSRPLAGGP